MLNNGVEAWDFEGFTIKKSCLEIKGYQTV